MTNPKTKASAVGLTATAALTAALASLALSGCGSLDSSKRSDPRKDLLDLRITEIHYHPADAGEVPGDEFEFIEIGNTGTATLDLTDVGFSDGVDFEFPAGTKLGAGKHLVVAALPARFQARYGFAPAGAYTGQLSNSGETVVLSDLAAGSVIDSVTYSDEGGWPGVADGGGHSLVPVSLSADSRGPWRASARANGSPGGADVLAALVNEVLTHTDPPAKDAIELHNPGDAAVDVGGWWLSDEKDAPAKYRIPANTIIPAKGYLVVDEDAFNASGAGSAAFRLGEHGEEVWLSSHAAGCDSGYCHGFAFGEAENGVSFGRIATSDGAEHFPAQEKATLGAANAGPRKGAVILSEVMYHSVNDTDDFLEVANVSGAPVKLFDEDHPANTWRIEGMAFRFPAGVTLAKDEVVLVIPARAEEARIRSVYALDSTHGSAVRIFKASGELSNATDTLGLLRPGVPYEREDSPGDTAVPYLLVDQVSYRDGGPWPNAADGEGESLQRKDPGAYGNDPESWSGAAPNPGSR